MKEIKAQISSDILINIIPFGAIDNSRNALTNKEATVLYDMWKNGKVINGKIMNSPDIDRLIISSLKNKGYIESNSITIGFTKKGKEAIKTIILGTEESAFLNKESDEDIDYEKVKQALTKRRK